MSAARSEAENTARYFVNVFRKKPLAIQVTEREWRRISGELVKGGNGRIIIHEEIEGGTRTHFFAPSEINSLEERTSPPDGWEHL